jgi:hypothetical protein
VDVECVFEGAAIEVRYASGLRDTAGNEAHAATFLRDRVIVLDAELLRRPREHRRILSHELFHFAWVRLGNARRMEWERRLKVEWERGARGEAGWSAEWRKRELAARDVRARTRRWREYCCESFCDSGALVCATGNSQECTLAERWVRLRAGFFKAQTGWRV